MEEHLHPVESILSNKLTPAMFGGDRPDVPDELLALNPKDGGLGIESPMSIATEQYKASKFKTQIHTDTIINQECVMRDEASNGKSSKEINEQDRQERTARRKQRVEQVEIPDHLKQWVEQAKDEGASSWLNTLPIREQQLDLNKGQFVDAVRLRYNQPLKNLPSHCPCGSKFNVEHALNCKKGGFVAQRHDQLRDMFTNLLGRVCKDVEAEPRLLPVTQETFNFKSANRGDESRLDIKAGGFWQRSQTAFFDIRVTHVNSSSQAGKATSTIFRAHEMEKKREYLQRVLDIEHGAFTPLVFGTNGGMGQECKIFIKHLATTLAEKTDEKYSDIITWLRTKTSIMILKSAIMCVRGSRVPFRKTDPVTDDFQLANLVAKNTER